MSKYKMHAKRIDINNINKGRLCQQCLKWDPLVRVSLFADESSCVVHSSKCKCIERKHLPQTQRLASELAIEFLSLAAFLLAVANSEKDPQSYYHHLLAVG